MASFGASRCGDRLARNMRRLGRPPRRCGVAVEFDVGPAHPRPHAARADGWDLGAAPGNVPARLCLCGKLVRNRSDGRASTRFDRELRGYCRRSDCRGRAGWPGTGCGAPGRVLHHAASPSAVSAHAASLHPIGAAIFAVIGAPAAALFALLHGAGNGLLTIARGTVPLAIFGPEGYGARTGLLGAPSRAAQAMAPFLFGLLLDRMGPAVLFVSAGLCLSALAALLALSTAGGVER